MFDPRWPYVICLNCGKDLLPAFPDTDYKQPSGGLSFVAHGNYGSTVFDPTSMSAPFLLIFICDECVVEKKDAVIVGQKVFQEAEYRYKPWDPDWDPGTMF